MGGKQSKITEVPILKDTDSEPGFDRIPLTPKPSRNLAGALFQTSSESNSYGKHKLNNNSTGCCCRPRKNT